MFHRIHHVALAVHSLEAALPFYTEALGLPLLRREVVATQGVAAALLAVGSDELELLEPLDPEGGVARFLRRKGQGPHHLCLETSDVAGALSLLQAANVPLLDRSPRPGLAGQIGFLHPAAGQGVLIELAQPNGTHHPPATHPAMTIETVVLTSNAPDTMSEIFCRHFGARMLGTGAEGRYGGLATALCLGSSHVTILHSLARPSATPGPQPEGLFGICIAVKDWDGIVRRLCDHGIRFDLRQEPSALATIPTDLTSGVALSLCRLGGA